MQSHMRRSAASGRTTEQIGPFLATFSLNSTNPYLNYAIPDDGARPKPSDVDALTAAYRRRDLLPRLEFLADTAPDAEAALLTAGYTEERRVPLMLCPPGSAIHLAAPPGIGLVVPESDEDIRNMMATQHEAFGVSPEVSTEDIAGFRKHSGFAVLARDAATGAPAGGGVAEPITDGTTEVAGIGVAEPFRRRGIGAAITAFLTVTVHEHGARTVFLTPAGVPEQRIYERVGYRPAADMVHLNLPG